MLICKTKIIVHNMAMMWMRGGLVQVILFPRGPEPVITWRHTSDNMQNDYDKMSKNIRNINAQLYAQTLSQVHVNAK